MPEPGQRQLLGANRPARSVSSLEDGHHPPGTGEGDGGCEPVRPAADHDDAFDHGSGDPKRELVQHREPLDPLGLSSPETTCPQNACCASRPATA